MDPKLAMGAAAAGAAVASGAAANRLAARRGESNEYRLRPDEPLSEGLARVARGRIRHALGELGGKTGHSRDGAVHEVRKDMKKLRAVLRLARGELGDDVYRRENETFRDAGRRLAGARDATVMIETLDRLAERFPDSVPDDAAAPLRRVLVEQRDAAEKAAEDGGTDEVAKTLKAARRRVQAWPLEHDDWSAIEPGLKRTYRRGRRALRAAEEDPSDENLHELRKRVKDLWYHLTILSFVSPDAMSTAAEEAHALSDRLGDDHDLAVLREGARERRSVLGGPEALTRLESAVHRRRADLQADALWLARRLYAERPRDFVGRLASYYGKAVT